MTSPYVVDAAAMDLVPEDVRELARFIVEMPDSMTLEMPDAYGYRRFQTGRVAQRAIEDGLRWAAGMLAHDSSEEAFELLVEAARWKEDLWTFMDEDAHDRALALLVVAMDPASPEVTRAVQSEKPQVRKVMAGSLDPRVPAAHAHVLSLAADKHTGVRDAARKSLRDEGFEIPWWLGLFPDDPFAGLDPSAAQSVAEPITTLTAVLGDPSTHTREGRRDTIRQALAKLPDGLVVALFPRLVHGEWDPILVGELTVETLRRQGGAEVVYATLTGPGADEDRFYFSIHDRKEQVAALPPARRAEVRRAMGNVPPDLASPVARTLFEFAMLCVEPEEDMLPVLEVALTRKYAHIADMLRRPPVPGTPLADTLANALREGFPEPWASERHAFRSWLARGPASWLRGLAEEAVKSENASNRRWGLSVLTDEAWEESRDGSRRDRAVALATDPRYAADFLGDTQMTVRVLGFLRERLRRGEASVDEAHAAMEALRFLESSKSEAHERWAAPGDLDPATPEEWAEFRKVREAACAQDPEGARLKSFYLHVRRPGHPEDDALLARWFADIRDGEDAGRAMNVLVTTAKGDDTFELARDLFERFGENRSVAAGWEFLRFLQQADERKKGKA